MAVSALFFILLHHLTSSQPCEFLHKNSALFLCNHPISLRNICQELFCPYVTFSVDNHLLKCYDDPKEVKTLKDRIKQIRKSYDLTQQEFAARLGTPRSNIANYEKGTRNPSDGIITYMCKEFGINEDWLRTGEGPMKRSTSREDEIEAMVTNALNGNANLTKAVVQALCNRTEKELAALEALLWDIVYNLQDAKKAQADSQPGRKIIKIAGRDGSLEEHALTDEDANEYLALIDQLPDAGDDL